MPKFFVFAMNVTDYVNRSSRQRQFGRKACNLGDSRVDVWYLPSQRSQPGQFPVPMLCLIFFRFHKPHAKTHGEKSLTPRPLRISCKAFGVEDKISPRAANMNFRATKWSGTPKEKENLFQRSTKPSPW